MQMQLDTPTGIVTTQCPHSRHRHTCHARHSNAHAACSTEGLHEVKRGIFTFRSKADVDFLHRALSIICDEFGIIPVQQAEYKTNRDNICKAFSQIS